MLKKLREYWVPTVERCGVILVDGSVIECKNVSETPAQDFKLRKDDLEPYEGQIQATWHTHPRTSANLSVEDYLLFLAYPDWHHYIISEDDVWCYYVRNAKVLLHEDDTLSQ